MKSTKKTNTEQKLTRCQHQPTGQWIRADKRLAIYLRDRFLCIYCCRDLHGVAPQDITLDHMCCQSAGGHDHSERNLVTACRSCNCSRQDKPLARFAGAETRKHIRRNVARDLTPYRELAKSLIAGTTGYAGEIAKLRDAD